MENEKLINNYRKSLEQKYNAVCFDIDGTLTIQNSKKIDNSIISMIGNLLIKRIPVVFITGRGETGLIDLTNDIYEKLLKIPNLKFENLKRMYALTNDGTRLFYTTSNKNNLIFNTNIYVSTNLELEQLKTFNNKIIKRLKSHTQNNICKISYSTDSKTNSILNIRIIIKNNTDATTKSIINIINNITNQCNLDSIVVTRGIYQNNCVIQIGTSKKEIAIARAEKFIGVPRNSMMRIGDCGDAIGNDYSMLNCEQGYSVDKTSGQINACFPIFDDNNNILKGVKATLFLIKKAKLLPTVCLEKANKQEYSYKYAEVESKMLKGRNKCLQYYNNIINKKFNTTNGINDLFDVESGSIKIPMYEWILIDPKNPLKQLWNISNEDRMLYSLRDNNNYLLRGSVTYYYFLANRKSQKGKDYTSFENVIEWYNNNLVFLKKALNIFNIYFNINDITNQKMILGVLDNIRNILLIILNYNLNQIYSNNNILINLNSKDNQNINKLFKLIYINDFLMTTICFENKKITSTNLKFLLSSTINILEYELNNFQKNNESKNYSKDFRSYREIDNFLENYIAIKINEEKIKSSEKYGICGMCYGGLELPIICKIINPKLSDVLALKFNKDVSGYANKQLVELRKFNIEKYGGILKLGKIQSDNIILLDDNILTGKTIQLAINSLYDEQINVSNVNVVRYPSINRIDQMFMKNHGAVDYNLFFNYITGLCFPSPYSWRDENPDDPYLDSLGVFDLNRKKIIECLVKNHDYKENSEVYEYKRRIKK